MLCEDGVQSVKVHLWLLHAKIAGEAYKIRKWRKRAGRLLQAVKLSTMVVFKSAFCSAIGNLKHHNAKQSAATFALKSQRTESAIVDIEGKSTIFCFGRRGWWGQARHLQGMPSWAETVPLLNVPLPTLQFRTQQ